MMLTANTRPPPESSSIYFNVAGYTLIAVESGLVGFIGANYWRAWRRFPKGRRLLPAHVVLISVGVLWLSGVAVARMIQFPRVMWGINTIASVTMIVAALSLISLFQFRTNKENK